MLAGLLLALREGLEAALIIGIVLSVLEKVNRPDQKPAVWRGTAAAVLLSLLFGLGLQRIGVRFEGKLAEVFEGLATLLAAGILTWMIFWFQAQGASIRESLERETADALGKGQNALFLLAFFAVFREGIELAVFLLAASFVSTGLMTSIGAILGLAIAVVLGWGLFSSTRILNLRKFFFVTNILLILFAAGLTAYGVHELNEAGWIPRLVEHIWDINTFLDENSNTGQIFKALFGYNGNPSLTEAIAYMVYLLVMGWQFVLYWRRGSSPGSLQSPV